MKHKSNDTESQGPTLNRVLNYLINLRTSGAAEIMDSNAYLILINLLTYRNTDGHQFPLGRKRIMKEALIYLAVTAVGSVLLVVLMYFLATLGESCI